MTNIIKRQHALAEKIGIPQQDLLATVSRLQHLLTPRQYEALSGFYGIGRDACRTLSEIGNGWGTDRERPRQVAEEAWRILKWEVKYGVNLPADPLEYTFEQLLILSRLQAAEVERSLLVRMRNGLRNGYEYPEEKGPSPMRWLTTQTEADLLRIPNFGRKCLDALQRVLKHAGLSLAERPPSLP